MVGTARDRPNYYIQHTVQSQVNLRQVQVMNRNAFLLHDTKCEYGSTDKANWVGPTQTKILMEAKQTKWATKLELEWNVNLWHSLERRIRVEKNKKMNGIGLWISKYCQLLCLFLS